MFVYIKTALVRADKKIIRQLFVDRTFFHQFWAKTVFTPYTIYTRMLFDI